MDPERVRFLIDDLEARLRRVEGQDLHRWEIEEVRDQAIILFERTFDGSNLIDELRNVHWRRGPLLRSLLAKDYYSYQVGLLAGDIGRVLRLARFALELDSPSLDGDAPAHAIQAEARQRLLGRLLELEDEAERAPLSSDDREQLLAALAAARSILERDADPASARRDLERVLGHAVAKVGRGGPAASLWRRIAEAVVLAEATVSLGLGISAIASPTAAQVSVVVEVEVPALPPGRPDTVPAPISALPPGQTG